MARFGTEPILRLFRRMAIPAVIGQLAVLANNFLDRMYVGHIEGCGGESLTAIGLSTPILLFTTAVAALVAGGSPLMAIALGEQKPEQAHRVVGTSLTFLASISLLLTLVIWLFMGDLLTRCGASSEILPYAQAYLGIIIWGVLSTNLTIGMVQFVTGQGLAKQSMRIIGLSVLLNMLLDPLFIFGFGWGIKGAALATTLSMTVSALLILRQLFWMDNAIRLRTVHLRMDVRLLGLCLGMGFAPFLAMACEALVGTLYNVGLSTYGGDVAVGAMAVYYIISHIMIYIIMGLSIAMQPIISYNYGRKSYGRVRKCAYLLIGSCIAVCCLFWGLLMGVPTVVTGLFTNDGEIAACAASYVRTYFGCAFLLGVPFACVNTLRFVRRVRRAILLVLFRQVVLSIPVLLFFPRWGLFPPVESIFLSAPLIDVVSGAVMLYFTLKTIRNLKEA